MYINYTNLKRELDLSVKKCRIAKDLESEEEKAERIKQDEIGDFLRPIEMSFLLERIGGFPSWDSEIFKQKLTS